MGVPEYEFRAALGVYFSLAAVATDDGSGDVTAITVEIDGVRKASKISRSRPEKYRLFINVTNLRNELPQVWVLAPANHQIGHVNIFSPAQCPDLGRSLPHLSWGSYPAQWQAAQPAQRTLLALLQDIQQYLRNPNYTSPAR